ncbi:cytospin-A isoform X2 [Lingula anatina]|nr:cytospin-A isoform X2 [Lingula anatina]XP_013412079.1 cytospin-A isoform X2 [Lingula anatina]XP_013412080.1 cytospin-A isoform X2 [Lingula anatina]XP_013412081.1 cytospin-A isoform X2 [Lingula anatina]XP_013412082.1 cytospin-A isoform X2 [Lingula anatina]XP_013412083.1 cytospin-A isoform X2 [Lingula anatina]XP_013412085.1 cytospin-A isoform X2 [Lingula anatina]XP_013412086.1 cytospin-A isoform X2 [Lingula anatina]XP_013412087.1 cytospin-A isoform X2 [Lingula anatina]|eukprot:XP_013412078.1 cytospin-A isoform X2 [Lingula anatina]
MKKTQQGSTKIPVQGKSPSSSKLPFEKSKSDLAATAVFKKPDKPPMSKNYLSKSHDNLAFTLRRRANTAPKPRPQSTLGIPKPEDYSKRFYMNKDTNKSPAPTTRIQKSRPTSGSTTSLRKAVSTQSIERTGLSTPTKNMEAKNGGLMKKSSSIQNIDKTPVVIKRAASSQTLSKERMGRNNRVSAPANVLAYNAELLANFEKEKRILESRISELIQITETRKAEIEKYKIETRRLKEKLPSQEVKEELDLLRNENRLLKDRLQELGISVEQITDTEKLSMLKKSHHVQKHLTVGSTPATSATNRTESSSAGHEEGPAGSSASEDKPQLGNSAVCCTGSIDNIAGSCAGESDTGLSVGELSCVTPDHGSCFSIAENANWETKSNKSSDVLSELSVACLQDRILQMEESHYSTNEELQATLQEFGDMQEAVNELSMENERLADEKAVLLESLCTQTEKLENCRIQIEHLKALLLTDIDNGDRSEREVQLVSLLKGAQEEREEMMLKQTELINSFHAVEGENREMEDIIKALRDKIHISEDKIESLQADKQEIEKQVLEQKERIENDQLEINRLKALVEHEKAKLVDLESSRNVEDKSELETLLQKLRQEKDKAETELAEVQDTLAHSQCEVSKLKETLTTLEEEYKVVKANQTKRVDELETQIQKVTTEKMELRQEADTLRDHIDQLSQDCDRYLESKKSYNATLSDLQQDLRESRLRCVELQKEIEEMQHQHEQEIEDWKQFQQDLQTAVVIANDIKTEAQEDGEKMRTENDVLRDQIKKLQNDFERYREEADRLKTQRTIENRSPGVISSNELKTRILSSADRELILLRQGRKPSDARGGNQSQSVKNLIRSIEDQVKTSSKSSSQNSSRRGSMDSLGPCSPANMGATSPKSETIKSPTGDLRRASVAVDTPFSHKTVFKKTPDSAKDVRLQRHSVTSLIYESSQQQTDDAKSSPSLAAPTARSEGETPKRSPAITSILTTTPRKNSIAGSPEVRDPLAALAKQMGGSKRNALLKWCQQKTLAHRGIDITNFSSSWNDGLAFCALLHSYMPDKIPYNELNSHDKRRNFTLAFKAAEKVGIPSTLSISEMAATERPDWMQVMAYVASIYKHFEFHG